MGDVEVFLLDPTNPHEGKATVSVLGGLDALAKLEDGPLVRMHSRCVYGEIVGSTDCDCGPQLETSKQRIREEGVGILFYLDQEGRGAGLTIKAKGYQLKEQEGLDTAEAYERLGVPFDQREYGHVVRFLLDHSITKVRLMSNNPRKISALEAAGITVIPVSLIVGVGSDNIEYLRTKRDKAGHLLPSDL